MMGQSSSFVADAVEMYARDFYSLSALGFAPTGRSSLESLVIEHLQSMITSGGGHVRCDWCGLALCLDCGECHNEGCEAYYELDCERDEDEEDEDDFGEVLERLEVIGQSIEQEMSQWQQDEGVAA